jgi:16S rRNA (adenine1518-N6/adenine1519-N6)-dimethyltransferase
MSKGYVAKKKFGQNFLQDQNIINKIVSAFAIKPGDCILEIGPGLGAITKPILNQISHINVVEIDRDLATKLEQNYGQKISLYNTSILDFDLNQIQTNNKIKIIGNLPYNISTPILFHLFNFRDKIESMLFMLQLEVVERMVASSNSKQYGRLSVMTQLYCDVEQLFTIPPTAFKPVPKVDSAIVRLQPNNMNYINKLLDHETFAKIVLAAFNQRRKTIANSLKDYISIDDFIKINLDHKLRAENLTIEHYISIANFVCVHRR